MLSEAASLCCHWSTAHTSKSGIEKAGVLWVVLREKCYWHQVSVIYEAYQHHYIQKNISTIGPC